MAADELDPERRDPPNRETPTDADWMARLCRVLEDRVAPALERIATALEQGSIARGPVEPAGPGLGVAMAEIRQALAGDDWTRVRVLLEEVTIEHAGQPELGRLEREVAQRRDEALGRLRARLEAARSANDAEGVLTLHAQWLAAAGTGTDPEFNAQVAQWLLGLIQRRLRGGQVAVDLAELAARVAERFETLREGASLRASLPVLRRSAGLCPRCAKPYAGLDDACPECQARRRLVAAGIPPTATPEVQDETDVETNGESDAEVYFEDEPG